MHVDHPTPYVLRDSTRNLLVARGVMMTSEDQRQQPIARGLYDDEQEGEQVRRAIADKLTSKDRQNARAGQAPSRPGATALDPAEGPNRSGDPLGTLINLEIFTGAIQSNVTATDFVQRVGELQSAVLDTLDTDPDVALLILVQRASTDLHDYSAKHALLVAVICELAARHLPNWSDEWRTALRCAALTMNIAMTGLQNQLALQESPVTAYQRKQIDAHARRGAQMLSEAGVTDALWLGAVQHHHTSCPDQLSELPPERQLARLLARSDIFAARLSPRKRRPAMSTTAAAKAAYLNENNQPDEAGSTIIKAIGIYPPGGLVRLGNGEVAVVLRRGQHAHEPIVLSLSSAGGTSLGTPTLRDTRNKPYEVVASVAPDEVRLRLKLESLISAA